MKFITIFIILMTLSFHSFGGGFVDESGKSLPEYKKIWNFVNSQVGGCPDKIAFGRDMKKDGFSRFNGYPPRVIMAKPPGHKNFYMILAHETSHVCLFSKTKGMSNIERFRFFDEGLADIMGGRFVRGEKWYRKKAFQRAKLKASNGSITFEKVQSWKSYFGKPPKVDFEAYMVGATFIYFIVEKYGQSKLNNFFSSIGKTKKLEDFIREVFGLNIAAFEKRWIQYVKSN